MTDLLTPLSASLAGRYVIAREIGRGGMATVFLARDVRHDRQVALKVLDPELGAVLGAERFLGEIKVTANLQHPNLLPLFDSGEANGLLFYVMPFVEGESLRARLSREKQLPVDEALRITIAVANALDYAHGHGVIHRDLKPENILLQHGQPVVADFGIALAVSNAGGARITQTGLSLGTPQYMSPEQATGDRAIDHRTDIYSLGAVAYEMLTGEPPHIGQTAQAVIARVLTEKPRSVRTSRPSVPAHVDAAVLHALEKLPADRFNSARELFDALNARPGTGAVSSGAMSSAAPATTAEREAMDRAPRGFVARAIRSPVTTVSGFAVAAVVAALWWASARRADPSPTVRIGFSVTPHQPLGAVLNRTVVLSPDGRTAVYSTADSTGVVRLFARAIGELIQRPIMGTEAATLPFFSDDGHSIGFFDGRQLKKVPSDGGTPTVLADVKGLQGATWGPTEIVISTGRLLRKLPASGGEPAPLARGDSTRGYWPVFLPSGKAVVYATEIGGTAELAAIDVASAHATTLGLRGTFPLGMVGGQLVFARIDGALVAVPFDADALKVTGTESVVVNEVQMNVVAGEAKAAVSKDGSLLYVSGSGVVQPVLVDMHGAVRPIAVPAGRMNDPRFSPDGRRVAASVVSAGRTDVWIYDATSGAAQRITSEGTVNQRPEWTPDGKRLLFRSNRREGPTSLWWQPTDGSAPAEQLVAGTPTSDIWQGLVSHDGRYLVYRTGTVGTADIWYRRMQGDTTSKTIAQTPFTEYAPQLSPDGKWIVYVSDESGNFQVYARPFPGPGGQVAVSIGGGQTPIWSRNGRRIFYANGNKIVAASVTTSPTFSVTSRALLFEGTYLLNSGHAAFDVTVDGKALLMLRPVTGGEEQIVLVHNWKAELDTRTRGNASR